MDRTLTESTLRRRTSPLAFAFLAAVASVVLVQGPAQALNNLDSAIRNLFGADVRVSAPANGEVLTYDSTSGTWGNAAGGGGGPGSDTTAIHDDTASEISALTLVTALAGDHVLIEDASDSNNKKRVLASDFIGSVSFPLLADAGTAAAPSYSFTGAGEDDNGMYLDGSNRLGFSAAGALKFTVDSGGAVFSSPLKMNDDIRFRFGTPSDATFLWHGVSGALHLGLSTSGGAEGILLLCHDTDVASDFGHAAEINPSLFVHSGTAPASATDEFVGLQHDVTDARIIVGSGDLAVDLGANAAAIRISSNSELLATTSGGTVTTSGLIPAGVRVLFVVGRVTTAVTTSSATNTFDVGDSGDADRYGAAIAGALNTTVDETDATADPEGVWSASGREVILDAAGAETFTAGAVRVTVFYLDPTPPGS